MSEKTQDDIDLNYYEGVRKQIISKITTGGIPSDKEMIDTLLKAVDGGSRVVLTKKRLEVDKEGNEVKAQTQAMVAEILKAVPTAKQSRERAIPLGEVEIVAPLPGETSVGTKELTYQQIMSSEHPNP